MKLLHDRPRMLLIAGLVLMVVGALDPLEGSVVLLVGSGLAALGGFLGRSARWRLQGWACGLIAVGVAALFGMSALGGLGEGTGRSMWWALILLPYPIGWVLGLVGAVLALRAPRPSTPG